MDKYTLNIRIENHVERIYDNVIISEIKNIIRDYLFNNPNKFNIYINENINKDKLLRTISRNLSDKNCITNSMILDEIIKYVEDGIC